MDREATAQDVRRSAAWRSIAGALLVSVAIVVAMCLWFEQNPGVQQPSVDLAHTSCVLDAAHPMRWVHVKGYGSGLRMNWNCTETSPSEAHCLRLDGQHPLSRCNAGR